MQSKFSVHINPTVLLMLTFAITRSNFTSISYCNEYVDLTDLFSLSVKALFRKSRYKDDKRRKIWDENNYKGIKT